MIVQRRYKASDFAPFVAFNAAVVVIVICFILAPLLSHFADRSEVMAEDAAQLVHFESVMQQANVSVGLNGPSNLLLVDSEEKVASADLQGNIKAIASNAGVNLIGMRGLPSGRLPELRMISVGVELEGSMASIRDMMRAIESQVPTLFVASASLHRDAAAGDDGVVRVEMTVVGAMRERAPQPEGEANPQ